jgi:hypothetical protein
MPDQGVHTDPGFKLLGTGCPLCRGLRMWQDQDKTFNATPDVNKVLIKQTGLLL